MVIVIRSIVHWKKVLQLMIMADSQCANVDLHLVVTAESRD